MKYFRHNKSRLTKQKQIICRKVFVITNIQHHPTGQYDLCRGKSSLVRTRHTNAEIQQKQRNKISAGNETRTYNNTKKKYMIT